MESPIKGDAMTIYLLTEAAEILGVNRRTLFRWIEAGKAPAGAVYDIQGNVVGFECAALETYAKVSGR